jgi:FdhD protein
MSRSPSLQIRVRRTTADAAEEVNDVLAVEEPLEIVVGTAGHPSKVISITMRTPGHDEELAAGFLFSEGIVQDPKELLDVHVEGDNRVTVKLSTLPNLGSLQRNFYTTSSCGVCGKTSIEAVRTKSVFAGMPGNLKVVSATLLSLSNSLRASQKVFGETGGLHASALFDTSGKIQLVREDVGRHNALDKIIGASLFDKKLPLNNTILMLSGRISFELVQKALMAGIPFVAAIGAPSTLAVELARESGMTLVGFLRDKRYTVYSGEQRIA